MTWLGESPDSWILMGATAITVVAGVTLVEDPTTTGPARSFTLTTIATCWLVATAWIPLLVAAEARRTRAGWPGFEPSRWSSTCCGPHAIRASPAREHQALDGSWPINEAFRRPPTTGRLAAS